MSTITPGIVFDVETTGLPRDGYQPVVVEVGAAIVTAEGDVCNPIGFFVRQPRELIYAQEAERAFEITGINREQVLAEGLEPELAADRLSSWVERVVAARGAREARAFNDEFDFGFLDAQPWSLFDTGLVRGECIMLAAMSVMGPAGALPPAPKWAQEKGQQWKWPRVAEAVAWFNGRGHQIRWGSQAHRAQEDAVKEALIAVAVERERAASGAAA